MLPKKITPMLKQYLSIKNAHKDKIVLFRMGDFYETFFEDAKICSKILGIILTSRSKKNSEEIPLAGFPYHSLKTYLSKLIDSGQKVVICEQVEDPKQAKGIVKREIVEIITPGSISDYNFLSGVENNFLSAIWEKDKKYGVASIDISTSDFIYTQLLWEQLVTELTRLNPKEILYINERIKDRLEKLDFTNSLVFTQHYQTDFDEYSAKKVLKKHFKEFNEEHFYARDKSVGIIAAALALDYLKKMKVDTLEHITDINFYSLTDYMQLDQFTSSNLEIYRSIRTQKKAGTLFGVIDKTKTPMGSRMLNLWLQRPLIKREKIEKRLSIVQRMVEKIDLTFSIQEIFKKIGDINRLISKIASGRINPPEVLSLSYFLESSLEINTLSEEFELLEIESIIKNIDDYSSIVKKIRLVIKPNPNNLLTEGDIIKSGYSQQLDELREVSKKGKRWIAELEGVEKKKTGISSLKIRYNKIFGYYIEVTKKHIEKVPQEYIKKQTLVNCERYISPQLKEYEQKVLGAEQRIKTIEYELFTELRIFLKKHIRAMQSYSNIIAELDIYICFAVISYYNSYSCPTFNSKGLIKIKNSRHPVVENFIENEQFIPNDVFLNNSSHQIIILTGPNMAGKSTYLRQVALISIMAQIGCFVPAVSASLPIFDRIFTRVGASDNLTAGHSTFLVEMIETSAILSQATSNSLIILDEVGRGTSTFDGLSLAWSIVEYLHNEKFLGAKTLFATHYHELTELEEILPRVKNYNFVVKKIEDKMVFLRKIEKGKSNQSYGIEVASLAGLPPKVIKRAEIILKNLEESELSANGLASKIKEEKETKQLDILEKLSKNKKQNSAVIDELKKISTDKMTPLEALIKITELKERLE